ncbi:MAG: hypothetical protein MKZ73_05895, partial [Alphaproteobacteria bacterium]|nr:hypothetical protein [Alphaproteobacteria bacterium]
EADEQNVDLQNNEMIIDSEGNSEQNLVPENDFEEWTDVEEFSGNFIGPLQVIPEGNEEENSDLDPELENLFGDPRNLPSDDILLTGIKNLDEKEYELDISKITNIDEIKRYIVCTSTMSAANKWQYIQNVGKWRRGPIDFEYILSLENPGDSKEIHEKMTWNSYGDAARARELKIYDEYGAIKRIKKKDLPKNVQILTGRFVYTMKSDPVGSDFEKTPAHFDLQKRLDARLCARGFQETLTEDVAANTAALDTMRVLFSLSPIMQWDFGNIDVSRAFFQSNKLERDVYMKPPPGAETDPEIVWKALKPIYGLCDSVKNWQLTVIEWFREVGAKPAEADQAVFIFSNFKVKGWYEIEPLKKIKGIDQWSMRPELLNDIKEGNVWGVCAVHVDDIFFMGVPEFIGWFQNAIKERFKVKLPKLNDILHVGLRVRKIEDGSVMVTGEDYERNIERIEIEPSRRKDINAFLVEEEEKKFRSQLGKIMWLARITRADITYEAAAVAQAFAESEDLEQNYEVNVFEPFYNKEEKAKE